MSVVARLVDPSGAPSLALRFAHPADGPASGLAAIAARPDGEPGGDVPERGEFRPDPAELARLVADARAWLERPVGRGPAVRLDGTWRLAQAEPPDELVLQLRPSPEAPGRTDRWQAIVWHALDDARWSWIGEIDASALAAFVGALEPVAALPGPPPAAASAGPGDASQALPGPPYLERYWELMRTLWARFEAIVRRGATFPELLDVDYPPGVHPAGLLRTTDGRGTFLAREVLRDPGYRLARGETLVVGSNAVTFVDTSDVPRRLEPDMTDPYWLATLVDQVDRCGSAR